MVSENAFIILFCVATAVAMLVRRYPMPYTVALVLTGLGLGELHVMEPPHLTQDLLFAVFLPGLLFEAAFHMQAARMRENAKTILALAVPGVIAAIGLTGVLTAFVVRGLHVDATFTLGLGLVLGALVAATDPIAVMALFRSMNVTRRLSLLVEGESLLNDGTAIVFFTLIIAFVTGDSPTLSTLVVGFFTTTLGGALMGIAIGAFASQLTKQVNEPSIEITLTVIAAYGSFVAAEQLHVSGVIATVAAGMVVGNYGRHHGMSPTTRLSLEAFWEYVAFALNSIVFLLIGFEVSLASLALYWREILAAVAAMYVARFGVVYSVTALLRRTSEGVPSKWTPVLAWGGIKGALSIVLALGLPWDLPHREQLVTMTVGVVLISILLQGLTMAPLLRRLGLAKDTTRSREYERARNELLVASLAMREIETMLERHTITDDDATRLRAPYQTRSERARTQIEALGATERDVPLRRRIVAVRHLLTFEREATTQDFRDDMIVPETHAELSDEIARRLVRLETGEYEEPADLLAPSADLARLSPEAKGEA
ncbi:MAG: Na+/H+ antiporter [Gemmatimonadaceae bacterium]